MINNKKAFISLTAAACLAVFGVFGCSPITITEEQSERIISYDKDFKEVLSQKRLSDGRLADLRLQFLAEKNIYEQNLKALREDFEAKRAGFYSSMQQIKDQLAPQREKIKAETAALTQRLRDKQKNVRAVKSMLKQARAIIKGRSGGELLAKDRQEWQKRFDALNEEYAVVFAEASAMKEELYILKLKQRSLIQ